ncbi:MAG TPA: hypothetical protein VEZ48_12050 [Sphingomonadaceae bacterium]|nr:hypothetical protein [Sphingomonadaceae bacterium]
MTNAVIDNSTITAVERVLGHIPIDRNYDLSGDLAAFENYLCAQLFYDRPVRIDDYKPEFSAARAANFSDLGIIQFDGSSYDDLTDQAKSLTSMMYLKVHGGQLKDDLLSTFLQDINLFVCPSWHLQSSDYFLRIRLLTDETGNKLDKYTPLMTAIFEQLSENNKAGQKVNWNKELVSSDGRGIPQKEGVAKQGKHQVGSDVNAFAAGLNWLAFRSVFYGLISEHLEATSIVHPIRSDFLAQYHMTYLTKSAADQREAVLAYFRKTSTSIVDQSNEVLGGTAFKMRTPLVSAWATAVAGSPRKAREHVLNMRNSAEASELRARMRSIEDLQRAGDADAARKHAAAMLRDFQSSVEGLFRKYGSKSEDPFGISVNVVSLSGSFKILPLLDKVRAQLPSRARSISLLRNITLDLLQSPTLGKVSDLLRSDANITSDELESIYTPKFEKPKFKHIQSSWKKPM